MRRLAVLLPLLAAPALGHDWNGMARAPDGSLYVVDAEDGQIWRVSPRGEVSVFVKGEDARACNHPHHLEMDHRGLLWLAGG